MISFEDKNFNPGKAASPKSKKKKKKTRSVKSDKLSDGSLSVSHRGEEEMEEGAPFPIKKIDHFVEVGFLLDQNDFRILDIYNEQTYDSNLKKYLFELQDPMSDALMNDLEYKIKKQCTENVGLFNEISPLYVSINMGRPANIICDDYIPQDHFRLIKREGVSLMGSRWLMINFLKYDTMSHNSQVKETEISPKDNNMSISQNSMLLTTTDGKIPPNQYIMRIVGFENETSCQFTFDLNFNDLLILAHGNIKLLEEEHSQDLC